MPWEPIPGRRGIEVYTRVTLPQEESEIMEPMQGSNDSQVRRMKITKADIRRYGATGGCKGCKNMIEGKAAANHSEECRKRIENELTKDEDPRIERMNERMERRLFEECERLGIAEEEPARMRSTLPRGDNEGGGIEENMRVRQAIRSRQRDLEAYGEEDMERSELMNENGEIMEEEDWKEDLGIGEYEESQEEEEDDMMMNKVVFKDIGNKWGGYEGRQSWDEAERKNMKEFEENWGDTGRICEMITTNWRNPKIIWDDISGKELEWALVVTARIEEMEEFRKHGVYVKVPIKECMERTGKKPIGVRWVDINKGDHVSP